MEPLIHLKLDEAFQDLKFTIDQYEIRTLRDRNKNDVGLIEYIRKGLICKSLENTINLISEIILSKIIIKTISVTSLRFIDLRVTQLLTDSQRISHFF